MTMNKNFLDDKERAIQSLEEAKIEGKVDQGILTILSLINNSSDYYTSSSCAGRVVLLEIPHIGDKQNAVFLGKWHRNVDSDEILSAVEKSKKGLIWLLAQSPIIHIVSKNIKAADEIVKIANANGFKNSGLKSVGKKIVIEVCSTERLDAPVGMDGVLFCNDEYLQLLIDIANDVMKKSTAKLHRFEQELKKYLNTHKTTYE